MRGKSYEGFAKKRGDEKFKKADRVERQIGPPCRSPICAKSDSRECNLITEDQRKTVFTLFWETMNWQQRKVYVSSLIDVGPKKRKTTNDKESRRSNTFSYHLVINGERKSVCREMFCHTLSLGTWSVQHWATTGAARENTQPHLPHPKPVPQATAEKRNTVKTFQSLPKLPSHYCRRTTNKLYLEPDVKSITNLYSMLKTYRYERGLLTPGRQMLLQEFRSQNLAFFQPKKEQCDVCCAHRATNISDEELAKYVERKERARAEKSKDKTSCTH